MTTERRVTIDHLSFTVKSPEEIAREGCPIVGVNKRTALRPYDKHYDVGTLDGFHCMVCSEELILSPSGQRQHAMGNPLMCLDCMVKTLQESDS